MRHNRYNSYGNYNNTSLARKVDVPASIPLEQPRIKQQSVPKDNSLLMPRIAIVAVTLAVFAFTMVARSNVLIAEGNGLVELRRQEAELIRQNDLLSLEVNKLKSPERINTIAKNTLGMTIAKQNIYINKEIKN